MKQLENAKLGLCERRFVEMRMTVTVAQFNMPGVHPLSEAVASEFACGEKPAAIARTLKMWPRTVYKVVQRLQETGSAQSRLRSGRSRTATSPRIVQMIRKRVQRNPGLSQRKTAPEVNLSPRSLGRIVKGHLRLHSYKRVTRQALTPAQIKKRKELSKKLLALLRGGRHLDVIWTDEKKSK